MHDAWFTPREIEDVFGVSREDIEPLLVRDGQIPSEEVDGAWLLPASYVDRLVLAMLARLPDRASFPKDDAVSLLLRYVCLLAEKRARGLAAPLSGEQYYRLVQNELADWQGRVKPFLSALAEGCSGPGQRCYTSFVQVG